MGRRGLTKLAASAVAIAFTVFGALVGSVPADAATSTPVTTMTVKILSVKTIATPDTAAASVTCKSAEAAASLYWGKSPYEELAEFFSEVQWCYNSTIVTSSSASYSGGTTSSGNNYHWDWIGNTGTSKACYVSQGSSFNCSGNQLSGSGSAVQCPGDIEQGSCISSWDPKITWRVAWKGYDSVSFSPAESSYTTTIIVNG